MLAATRGAMQQVQSTVVAAEFDIAKDLDERDIASMRTFNATLARLRERKLERVEKAGPLAKSKLAWKIATYGQSVIYRVVMLAEGCALNWNAANVLCAYLAARALVETAALVLEFEHELQAHIIAENLGAIDALVMNRTFASRDEEGVAEHPEQEAKKCPDFHRQARQAPAARHPGALR